MTQEEFDVLYKDKDWTPAIGRLMAHAKALRELLEQVKQVNLEHDCCHLIKVSNEWVESVRQEMS